MHRDRTHERVESTGQRPGWDWLLRGGWRGSFGRAVLAFSVVSLIASAGAADRVVLVRPTGADETRLDDLEDILAQAIQAAGHSAVTERAGVDPNAPPPTTGNEMRAVADLQNAAYVVATELHDPTASTYHLRVRVGYAPESRLEAIDVAVPVTAELPRLIDVLRSMLRPEGLGDEALRLTQDSATSEASDSEGDAETQANPEADVQAQADAEAEALRLERERQEAEQAEAEAWRTRERYAQPATLDGQRRDRRSGACGVSGGVAMEASSEACPSGLDARSRDWMGLRSVPWWI